MTGPREHVDAVVFDLLYTLVHPGTFPGGVDRIAWLVSLIHVDEVALRERNRDFEPLLDSGRGPAPVTSPLRGSWRAVEPILESGRAPGGEAVEPEIQWVLDCVEALNGHCDADTLAVIRRDWDLTRRRALRDPDPSAIPTIQALQAAGIRVGVLSNTHAMEIRTWPECPLASAVDAVVFSHEIGFMKPEAAAFQAILDRLGTTAGRAVFVGDGGSNELDGATRAGFARVVLAAKAPLALTPERLPHLRARAHTSVGDLSELLPMLGVGPLALPR